MTDREAQKAAILSSPNLTHAERAVSPATEKALSPSPAAPAGGSRLAKGPTGLTVVFDENVDEVDGDYDDEAEAGYDDELEAAYDDEAESSFADEYWSDDDDEEEDYF